MCENEISEDESPSSVLPSLNEVMKEITTVKVNTCGTICIMI